MDHDAWRPGRYESLGPLGRTILPAYVGLALPLVVALACYFDDSNSGDLQIHVVGGYLAPVKVWDEQFAPAWNKVLRNAPYPISEFKASACLSGDKEFRAWTMEQREQLISDLVSVILDTRIWVGISAAFMWPGTPDATSPKIRKWRRRLEKDAYKICVGYCLSDSLSICRVLHETNTVPDIDEILPVIDHKKKFSQIVSRNFDLILRDFTPEIAAKIARPIERDSKLLVPLQAADLLAHETLLEVVNRCEGNPPSKTLERLLGGRTRYASKCFYLPPADLYHFMLDYGQRPKSKVGTIFSAGMPGGPELRTKGQWRIDD